MEINTAVAHDTTKQSLVFWRYALPGTDDGGLPAGTHAASRFAS
ncbi:hypothetical protein [Burkholderia glumae]|nr:hypothetical protein [Burkholderia glumae]